MVQYGQNFFVAATDSNSGVVLYSSFNVGSSFSTTQVTSSPVMNGAEMTMCSDGQGSLYLFWENQNDDKMYYATASATSGSITKSATALPGSYSWMDQPSCATENGNVWVLYRAYNGSAINLYYTKLGSGSVLSSQTQVTNNSAQEDGGRIAVSDGVIYVTYADIYASNNINLVKSSNNFTNPVRVNKTVGKIYSYGHELTIDSARSKIVVAYSDSTSDYEGDMVVAVSDLQGSSFSYAYPSSSTYRNQVTPKLIWSSGKLVVAWTDGRNNNYDVYAALSNDGGLTFQQNYNLTNESGEQSLRGLTDSAAANGDIYFTASNTDSFPTVKAFFYKSSALAVASLTGLSVSGASSVNSNGSAQFSANASYSDNISKSVSPTWSVSGSAADISSSGYLTAYSVNSDTSVTVTASYTESGITKTATQSVTIKAAPPTLTGLSASCPSTLNAGASASCTVSASYSNGASSAVNATWSSSNTSAVTMSGNTLMASASVYSNTSVTLTASYTENGVTKTTTQSVTVNAAILPLTSLALSCPASIIAGSSASCTTTASYQNGSSKTVSASLVSGNTSVISVSGSTLTASVGVYTNTSVPLTASYTENGVTKTATQSVTVSAAILPLTGLALSCPASINAGSSASCTTTAGYQDGSSKTVSASLSSSNASVLFVSGSMLVPNASFYTNSNISVVVTASYTENGVTKTATQIVTVSAAVPPLTGLALSCPASINASSSASCTTTANYQDGTSKTVSASLSSSNTSVLSVSGSTLVASANVYSDASVTVTASYTENGVTKTATQSVIVRAVIPSDDHGNSIGAATTVQPDSLTPGRIETGGDKDYFRIDVPSSGSLTVTTTGNSDTYGFLLDGRGQSLGQDDDSGAAYNFLLTRTVMAGTYYVVVQLYNSTATGAYTLASSFTPSSLTLTGLSATCPSSLNAGGSVSCTVSAGYSNGASSAVNATWFSSNSSVATVNGNNVTASGAVLSDTSVILTASYTENGITKTATQTVLVKASPAQLSGLTASCPSSLNAGGTAVCTATANYTNSTSNTVNAIWTSSDSTVATVSGSTVTANAGLTTDTPVSINASYTENGITKTATAMVAVKAAILTPVKLLISGASSVKSGETASYTATLVYNDGSSKTADNAATWTISGSGASVDSTGTLTAATVMADTTVTLTVIYTEGQVTKIGNLTVTIKAAIKTTACSGTSANLSGITIAGNSLKKSGESLDVSYCLKSFNSASKFDIYVAVQLPDGNMFFLQTAGFFGTPSFVPLDARKVAAKYLENTLIPDRSGSVLSISTIPLELPTGTYTFYAIPVLAGKDVWNGFNWVGDLAKAEVTLSR
ncbi:MAG: hypothetical protein WC091_16075 [Sulfuricellaceae bacterium]